MIKKNLKKIIAYTWQWLYLRGLFPGLENKAVVFMLHRMSTPDIYEEGHSPEFLNQVLSYFKRKGYRFISLRELIDCIEKGINPPKKSIAFTIDDGFEDQTEIAAPIFIKNNCPVTIFLITDFIDTGVSPWDSQVKHIFLESNKNQFELEIENKTHVFDLTSKEKRLSSMRLFRDKCKECSDDKLNLAIKNLTIQAGMEDIKFPIRSARPSTWEKLRKLENDNVLSSPHTKNHAILSQVSSEVSKSEITGSWNRVKEKLNHPCPVFAYPTGRKQDFSSREIKIFKTMGLSAAVTAIPGYIDFNTVTDADKYLLNRFSFSDNLEDLIQCVSGLEYVKSELFKIKYNLKHHGRKYMLNYLFLNLQYYIGLFRKYEQVEWDTVKRLVFVCKGNICRSPYAEMRAKSLGIPAVSIGLDTKEGSPANEQAIKSASYRGVVLDGHRARVYMSIQLTENDLVVCMEPHHLKEFRVINSNNCQLTLLGLLGNKQMASIMDPYGKTDEFFDECFSKIDNAILNINNLFVHSDCKRK